MLTLHFDWITIPAGDCWIGSDPAQDELALPCELPQHQLYLPTYQIARVPVTVAQFAAFIESTGYCTTAELQSNGWGVNPSGWYEIPSATWRNPRGGEDESVRKAAHPVTCVSWHDAVAFCRWAGVRLPSVGGMGKGRARCGSPPLCLG